jgi:hypothetical protein
VLSGLAATLVGLVELGNDDVDKANETLGALGTVDPGVGLWLVIVGGLVVAAGGVVMLLELRSRPLA